MKIENALVGKQEQVSVTTELLTPKDLIEIMCRGDIVIRDERFLPTDKGGVFKYFDPEDTYESWSQKEGRIFSAVKEGDTVAGLGLLRKNPREENTWWIGYITIDPKFQGKGYATKLSEKLFEYAHNKGITVETSGYSTIGDEKLRKVFKRCSEKYHVPFIDREGISYR